MELSKTYEQLILGKSWPSLSFAVLEAKRGRKNLVVDDRRFKMGDKWIRHIGELEKNALQIIGRKAGVNCLSNIGACLRPSRSALLVNDKIIELGSSPIANLKELARKLPECFSEDFVGSLSRTTPEDFDQEALAFLREASAALFGSGAAEKDFFPSPAGALEGVFQTFLAKLEGDNLATAHLRYILQALYQPMLSNNLSKAEARYLLASALSPRYEVDAKALEESLEQAYAELGGKIKRTSAQSFEVYRNRLERVLLESWEGVIGAERAFLFGHFDKNLPFEYAAQSPVYHSVEAQIPLDHNFVPKFKGKRLFFSSRDRMGTDFPHWEAFIGEDNVMRAAYVYAYYQGSKPSFYCHKAAEDLFASLSRLFPGLERSHWDSTASFSSGSDVWLDNSGSSPNGARLRLKSAIGESVTQDGNKIKDLSYCGPLRARYLGSLGYIFNMLAEQ